MAAAQVGNRTDKSPSGQTYYYFVLWFEPAAGAMKYEDRIFLAADRQASRMLMKPLVKPAVAGISIFLLAAVASTFVPTLSVLQTFLVCIFAFAVPYLITRHLEKV